MRITSVKYVRNYILEVTFYTGEVKRVNLRTFLMKAQNPMTTSYRDIEKFKKVKLVDGHLSWGNSQMDLGGESLYQWKD
jgi:hypothetical protein